MYRSLRKWISTVVIAGIALSLGVLGSGSAFAQEATRARAHTARPAASHVKAGAAKKHHKAKKHHNAKTHRAKGKHAGKKSAKSAKGTHHRAAKSGQARR